MANRLTRRQVLQATGVVAASGGLVVAGISCDATPPEGPKPSGDTSNIEAVHDHDVVPAPPIESPIALKFFNPEQVRALDALLNTLFPGDANDPGAREANVLVYIDSTLSQNDGVVTPTYSKPPFMQTFEGDAPPGPDTDMVTWVRKDAAENYGHQSSLTPKEAYRRGLASLDSAAQTMAGAAFADLSVEQQEALVEKLANKDGKVDGFDDPSGYAFFKLVMDGLMQGLFSDPAYGGNKDMVGWRLIGCPGAQRAYTESDIKTQGTSRPPQSLAQLHPMYPGRPNTAADSPVRGAAAGNPVSRRLLPGAPLTRELAAGNGSQQMS